MLCCVHELPRCFKIVKIADDVWYVSCVCMICEIVGLFFDVHDLSLNKSSL